MKIDTSNLTAAEVALNKCKPANDENLQYLKDAVAALLAEAYKQALTPPSR